MEKELISFKVSARTAKLIGLENFSNGLGAVTELVKNTYDADARVCLVIFNPFIVKSSEDEIIIDKSKSSIYVIDDGIGMSKKTITNQWMTLGTDDKLYEEKSPNGRIKTGAKGIGRFALNRLGNRTHLQTFVKGGLNGVDWKVRWSDFDEKNKTVSDIKATLESLTIPTIREEISKLFDDHHEVNDILNQMSRENGTSIKINDLNDDWLPSDLDSLYDNLELLLPPTEHSDFKIFLFSAFEVDEYGKINTAYFDDYDYKIKATYLNDESNQVELEVHRAELDYIKVADSYSDLLELEDFKKFPFDRKTFESTYFTDVLKVNELISDSIDKDLLDKIGKFEFIFYFLKLTKSDDRKDGDRKKYPYKNFNSANRKAWLKRFGGIKIFRDDFRIRPYGEGGQDWLNLGKRQAQSPGGVGQKLGGYKVKPNQISGVVKISRLENSYFQDKSGREGIIENDVFALFQNILLSIISYFENDRNTIMFNFSQIYEDLIAKEDAKRKAIEKAKEISSEGQKKNSGEGDKGDESDDDKETLAEGVELLAEESEEKDKEIRLLRSLASVGLIISSFAHEVKSLRSRLIPRTQFLKSTIKDLISIEALEKLNQEDNPVYMIDLMQTEDIKLKHWLDYSLSSLKKDKRSRTTLNFNDYFYKFKSTWIKALEQRKIKIELNFNDSIVPTIRAYEVDMDSIFNNLLSNSLNALKGQHEGQKQINISWVINDSFVEIVFSDNGKGLDSKYKKNPNEIFKLNESSRSDKFGKVIGTGMGLYMVKSIISEYGNATIEVQTPQIGFSVYLKFKMRENG